LRLRTVDLHPADQLQIERHLVQAVDVPGLARRTRRSREGAIRRLAWWLRSARDVGLADATALDLAAWAESILRTTAGNEAAEATRRAYTSHVREFYAWLSDLDDRPSPAAKLKAPPNRRRQARAMDEASLTRALRHLPEPTRTWVGLAACVGLRAGEIAAMRGEDVDRDCDPPELLIKGKGDRERRLPLSEVAWELLVPHLRRGPLWRSGRGRRLTADDISARVSEGLRDLGIPYTCHSGRHFFGRRLYRATRDLRLTQEALGHASVVTTMIYTEGDLPALVSGVRKVAAPLRQTVTRRGPRSA
jgi:integrase/recombinase XerC